MFSYAKELVKMKNEEGLDGNPKEKKCLRCSPRNRDVDKDFTRMGQCENKKSSMLNQNKTMSL